MTVTQNRIEKNLQAIRGEIVAACERSGRDASKVSIVAVTKSVNVETIRNLIDVGMLDLGESRVQQLTDRVEEIDAYLQRRRKPIPSPVRWHMIGHLQRNKVKPCLQAAEMVHSVDSLRLAEEINTRSEKMDRTTDVFLQVNCSKEQQKYGCAVGAAQHLAEMICSMDHIRLVGLMTMAPYSDNPEQDARPSFRRLREIFDDMKHDGIGTDAFRHLSMGMSNDYVQAVEEGATVLRIGTALFE
ncbi:MAG: YggS family pyridoxal phosphate-dependent enzyme [Phycisphaerae bacterium]